MPLKRFVHGPGTSVSNRPVKNYYGKHDGKHDPLKLNLCVLLDNALHLRVLFQ